MWTPRAIVFIRGGTRCNSRESNRSIETRVTELPVRILAEFRSCINIVWRCIIDGAFERSVYIYIHFVPRVRLRTIATLLRSPYIPCRTFVAMNRLWARKASMRIWRWDSHSLFSITLQPWFRAIKWVACESTELYGVYPRREMR